MIETAPHSKRKVMTMHVFYIVVILAQTLVIAFFLVPRLVERMYLGHRKAFFIRYNGAIQLLDPLTGAIVGHLRDGVWLQSPTLQDLRDTDLGDHTRVKLLIDIKNPNVASREESAKTDYFAVGGEFTEQL